MYPGDFEGEPRLEYRPATDGNADPGEIVWTWVPFEENNGRGKDRPVLVIGADGPWLPGHDIGRGSWDAHGRASEVRLDRILRIDPTAVRREDATIDARRFDQVAAALRKLR